jgi:hypothetical protein
MAGGLELRRLACGRHEILIEPNVRRLAQELSACLAASGSRSRSGVGLG